MQEKIAILDAGAQYGKVIDRRVRELNVETEIMPLDSSAEELKDYKGIILTGGPESVYGDSALDYDPQIFNLGIPVLGICYGAQLMNYVEGGKVEKKQARNDGQFQVEIDNSSDLFYEMDEKQNCLFTHGDSYSEKDLAPALKKTGEMNGIIASFENSERKLYGVQFHPEVDLTDNGTKIFRNFLYRICRVSGVYTIEDRIQTAIEKIKQSVGDKKVLCLVSGGVDSTVCSALLCKALGKDKVYAIHIDNGFMRKDESRKVKTALEEIGLELKVIDASNQFYNGKTELRGQIIGPLKDTINPEEKRNIIGDTFMKVAEKAIEELGLSFDEIYLAQGTLRPDLIESASKIASSKADVIKTHHNDTNLVRKLRESGRVIEPLRDYHKDEVRRLGRLLQLPEELVERQPFPGPGLGVRIICSEKPYIHDDFNQINEQLKKYGGSSIKATLLPIQTVGVQGDGRTYSYLVGLSGEKNWEELFRIAKEIPREISKVNRIAYIFGRKIKGDVKSITPTFPRPDAISQLQNADDIVNTILLEYGLTRKLSQVPVVSFPVNFGFKGKRSIAIRTFITNDFMTGKAAAPGQDFPEEALDKMVKKIKKNVEGIARIAYDLTSKPPGTTEWE